MINFQQKGKSFPISTTSLKLKGINRKKIELRKRDKI